MRALILTAGLLSSCTLLLPLILPVPCEDGLVRCDGATLVTCEGNFETLQECAVSCDEALARCTNTCGDLLIDPLETCDDGNSTPGDGCDAQCQIETPDSCGNGTLEAPEECDGADLNDQTCADFNFDSGVLICSITCQLDTSGCFDIPSSCGDTVLDAGEVCDDGNNVSGDGCRADCQKIEVCPDGTLDQGEACDDNNQSNGDGCSAACAVENGFTCAGAPSSCAPICGDGLILTQEQCDDDNNQSNDGCSSLCQVEPGFNCSGAPSLCSAICGDSITAGNEECDDGNTANGDGCDSNCQDEIFLEQEPNDDGSVQPNNNADFSAANANGPFTGDVLIQGGISPLGDEDGFEIHNPGGAPVSVIFETFGVDGVGTCDIDPQMFILSANGAELAFDDDGGLGTCERISFTINAGQTVFALVMGFDDDDAFDTYFLRVNFQ
jgi:cysteine-rich repeat protein